MSAEQEIISVLQGIFGENAAREQQYLEIAQQAGKIGITGNQIQNFQAKTGATAEQLKTFTNYGPANLFAHGFIRDMDLLIERGAAKAVEQQEGKVTWNGENILVAIEQGVSPSKVLDISPRAWSAIVERAHSSSPQGHYRPTGPGSLPAK